MVATAYINRPRFPPSSSGWLTGCGSVLIPCSIEFAWVHAPGPLNVDIKLMGARVQESGDSIHRWLTRSGITLEGQTSIFSSRELTRCHCFFSLQNDDLPLGWDTRAHPCPQTLCIPFHSPSSSWSSTESRPRRWGWSWWPLLVPHALVFSNPSATEWDPWELPFQRDLLSQISGMLFQPFQVITWPLKGTFP